MLDSPAHISAWPGCGIEPRFEIWPVVYLQSQPMTAASGHHARGFHGNSSHYMTSFMTELLRPIHYNCSTTFPFYTQITTPSRMLFPSFPHFASKLIIHSELLSDLWLTCAEKDIKIYSEYIIDLLWHYCSTLFMFLQDNYIVYLSNKSNFLNCETEQKMVPRNVIWKMYIIGCILSCIFPLCYKSHQWIPSNINLLTLKWGIRFHENWWYLIRIDDHGPKWLQEIGTTSQAHFCAIFCYINQAHFVLPCCYICM